MDKTPLYNRKSLAAYAGVSVRTVDEHVARGNLMPVRIGKAIRFTHEEVARWLGIGTDSHVAREEATR